MSEIKFSERNLLIGPFLHSTPNSITIPFRHLACHGGGDLTSHGGGGPLENQEACPFKYESIATVGEIRVWWRADFQSGSRVLKKVF